ncbi:hypothetical protein BJ878DRAFT_481888 [Calycina marina]|uniref:FAD/NAD(P)-binding domain-containing protein n=1 Tax=Calycina marina TaxID=1763456 RepID=A0A9P8CDC1_9HELO|nr:hypothetical protein BJ878DRAFT_481888 [Calycina marina]
MHVNLDELTRFLEKVAQDIERTADVSKPTKTQRLFSEQSIISHTPKFSDKLPYLDYPADFPEFLTTRDIISWTEPYQKAIGLNTEFGIIVQTTLFSHQASSATSLHPESTNGSTLNGQIYHTIDRKSARLIPDLNIKKACPFLTPHSITEGNIPKPKRLLAWTQIVIIGCGCGTSAFDIAQGLIAHGGPSVTIIQCGPTLVVSITADNTLFLGGWKTLPTSSADLVGDSFPLPIALIFMISAKQMMAQHDAALLAGFEKAGLMVKRSEDGVGLLHYHLFRGRGGVILIRAGVRW